MNLRRLLAVDDQFLERLAVDGAEHSAFEIVFGQTDLAEYAPDQRDMIFFAAVRGDQRRQLLLGDVILLEPAVLDEGKRLERFGGGTPEHWQIWIADGVSDLAVAIDRHDVAAMNVLHMPRARVMQQYFTHTITQSKCFIQAEG